MPPDDYPLLIRVSPADGQPTHDISLSDGATTIGLHLCNGRGERDHRSIRQSSTPRTSLQIQQGDPDYSGFNLPYTPQTQKDWSGGRGQGDFKRDSTRYYDSYRVNTIHGDIILGPKETAGTGYYTTETVGNERNSDFDFSLNGNDRIASEFVPAADLDVRAVSLFVHRTVAPGKPPSSSLPSKVKVSLWTSTAGTLADRLPDTLLAVSAERTITSTDPNSIISFPLVYSLTGGTRYWIAMELVGDVHIALMLDGNNTGNKYTISYPGVGTWVTYKTDSSLYAELRAVGSGYARFFSARGSMFALLNSDEGGPPKLYRNGLHNLATSNAANKFRLNTPYGLTGLNLTGQIAKIIAGPGMNDDPNWREVVSNSTSGAGDYLTVNDPWDTTHTTATEFATLGDNRWLSQVDHGLTQPVTDVCVVGDIVYFAMGDETTVRRGKMSANGWTWADEAAATKATFIKLIPTANGSSKIWLAQSGSANVYSADVVAWGTNLTLTQSNGAKPCGSPQTKITNMVAYGDPRIPYIFKEDGFGSIGENGFYAEVPSAALETVASEDNGRAACVFDVYLFFSLRDGFERFFDQRLDDIGPNRDEGLPTTRKGTIVHAIPYAGGVLCALDAGRAGYSSILFWSSGTGGWHELYRAPLGQRIRHMKVQVIPGEANDRLWFCQGQEIYWIPAAINAHKQPNYPFTPTGYLITSWYKTTLGEIVKFWRDMQLFSEALSANAIRVTVAYQVDDADDDDAWITIPGGFSISPVQRALLNSLFTVAGKRIRFKVTLSTNDSLKTPRVLAWTINAVTRVPPSRTWALTFQADDMNVDQADGDYDQLDRSGTAQPLDMNGLLAQLEVWANSEQRAAPILMRSVIPQYDNKYVFIDSPNVQLREVDLFGDGRTVKSIGSLNLYEA